MKRLFMVFLLLLSPLAQAASATVNVQGIVCAFCAQGIKKKFSKQAAVESVDVDLEKKTVFLKFKNNESLTDEVIKKLITEAGYNVTKVQRQDH